MGLTFVELEVANPASPDNREKVEFLVDSGAVYSIVPEQVLARLGIEPTSKEQFFLANGEKIVRKRGNALFFLDGKDGASPVIFGEEGDSTLLGVVTLESLGKILDPIHRELKPIKMVLG